MLFQTKRSQKLKRNKPQERSRYKYRLILFVNCVLAWYHCTNRDHIKAAKFSGKRPAYIYPGNVTAAVPYTTTGAVSTAAADFASTEGIILDVVGNSVVRIQCLTDPDIVG